MNAEDGLDLSKEDVSILTVALEFVSMRRDLSAEETRLLSFMQQFRQSWPYVPKRTT